MHCTAPRCSLTSFCLSSKHLCRLLSASLRKTFLHWVHPTCLSDDVARWCCCCCCCAVSSPSLRMTLHVGLDWAASYQCSPDRSRDLRSRRVTSLHLLLSTSASSIQSVTGYSLAHQHIMSIHLLRGIRDFGKELESLIDFIVMHVGQIYLSSFFLALLCCNCKAYTFSIYLPVDRDASCNDGLYAAKYGWSSLNQGHLTIHIL